MTESGDCSLVCTNERIRANGLLALKEHKFFGSVDWIQLEDLELEPPVSAKRGGG